MPIPQSVFKAYDIRGVYPAEIDEDFAYRFGRSLVVFASAKRILVGRDVRQSSPALAEALIKGILDQGADVDDAGMISTDALYFGQYRYDYDAAVTVSASHNPAKYNGFKALKRGLVMVTKEDATWFVRQMEAQDWPQPEKHGQYQQRDILGPYVDEALKLVDVSSIKPYRLVVDGGNGIAGQIFPLLQGRWPVHVIPMLFEPDGTFPNHTPNPLDEQASQMVKERILAEGKGVDGGIALDGDGDRVFLFDEHGNRIGGDALLLLIARAMLAAKPGAKVAYNLICSHSVPEQLKEWGLVSVKTRVGHAFIKKLMQEQQIPLGGEYSGHFYFQLNGFCEYSLIALLYALRALSADGRPWSRQVAELISYHRSGEINLPLAPSFARRGGDGITGIAAAALKLLKERYPNGVHDELDGLTIEFPDWWFNARPSNTEPLLRLTVEAKTRPILEEKVEELLGIIR